LNWKKRPQAGGRFAIWLIREAARRCGRRFVRPFLYPITLYFYLRRRMERRVSAAYLARVHDRAVGPLAVLAHIHAFASVILDRVFLLTRGFAPFDIRLHGYEQLQAQIARGNGVLLLGAHHGSFEALSVLKQQCPDVLLKVVMDRQQTADLNRLLYTMNADVSRQIIEVGSNPGEFALQLQAVTQQGGVIGLLGDRVRAGESVVSARFLGAPAEFPVAPYLIASMLKVPVVLGFGIYRGGNRYDLHFEVLAESIQMTRAERPARLREWAQRYAERLEHYTRLAPYNWFNFYDFWQRPVEDAAIDAGALVARSSA
jgi:predicted LPLAT superfamily acyltransferase